LVGTGLTVDTVCAIFATGAGGGLLHAVTANNKIATNPRCTSFMVISSPVS
jgi:hypothetical protein